MVVANAAIVPTGATGAISVYVTNPTHVFVDINGYFAPLSHLPYRISVYGQAIWDYTEALPKLGDAPE